MPSGTGLTPMKWNCITICEGPALKMDDWQTRLPEYGKEILWKLIDLS